MVTPLVAQRADHLPHVAPQLDVDAGGGLVEEQDLRLVRQRLGDHHAALHAARQRHDLGCPSCPTATGRAAPSRCRPGLGGLPNRPRLKRHRGPDASRTRRWSAPAAPGRSWRAPRGSRATMSWPSAMTVPAARLDDAADDADQRGLAGAVRPEQGEDLAAPDLQVDALERLEARGVGLRSGSETEMMGCTNSFRKLTRQAGTSGCHALPDGSRQLEMDVTLPSLRQFNKPPTTLRWK